VLLDTASAAFASAAAFKAVVIRLFGNSAVGSLSSNLICNVSASVTLEAPALVDKTEASLLPVQKNFAILCLTRFHAPSVQIERKIL